MKRLALLGLFAGTASYVSEHLRRHGVVGSDAKARGRRATRPEQMTLLGWKDIFWRTLSETSSDRLFLVAAAVAFYALMSIVPGLSALISIYGLFADPLTVSTQLAPVLAMLPDAARPIVAEHAERIAGLSTRTLSLNLIPTLALALWSANAGTKAMFDALNVIYDEEEKRSFFKLNAISLLTTFGALIVLILFLVLAAGLPQLLRHLPFSYQIDNLLKVLRWPVLFVVSTIAIAAVYWIGPSRTAVRFRWLVPGALLAAALWIAVSIAFAWYARTMTDYSASYGSMAAVIVMMMWLWLSVSMLLVGAELSAELEHQTAADTTIGRPKPRGLRGAVMADTVGEAVARR